MAMLQLQKMVDKAARRAGHIPELLTPEQIDVVVDNLYLLLSHMATKGLNLWKVVPYRFGIINGQKTYTLPAGTERILNINYVTGNNLATGTGPWRASGAIQTIGVKWTIINPATTVASVQGPTASQSFTFTPTATGWQYVDVPISTDGNWILTITGGTVSNVIMMNNLSEIPMAPLNRDDYWNLPNKEFQSGRPLQYWFNRQITPEVNLWPVGSDETVNLNALTFVQIKDPRTLTLSDTIDIPQRWEPTVQAKLAVEAGIELPNTEPSRLKMLMDVADRLEREASDDESDDAPIYFAPNISYYTR